VTLGDGVKPLAAFGEIGLTGEVRHVAHPERRLAEARKFGLDSVIAPEARTVKAAIRAALRGGPDSAERPAMPEAA
jgi:DNA repair protein RadA/Sms